MKANVGGIDRIIRIAAGSALLAWVLFFSGPIWAWVGLLPILTGLINFCPAYSIFGISTCHTK
jgi:hypothetical protein